MKVKEYFIVSNSFAAPFFSDRWEGFAKGKSARDALLRYIKGYRHPAGLYAAEIYKNADSYHHNDKPMLRWICNHEIAKREATKDLGAYSFLGHEPGKFEVNGRIIVVSKPKEGSIQSAQKSFLTKWPTS